MKRLLYFFLFAFPCTEPRRLPPAQFRTPPNEQFDHIDPLIGNGGDTPNGSGGMIPSTTPPFAMTRWVAQTHQNYVSVTPYNHTATSIHGFQATRQPAIWMGESASVVIVPGFGTVKADFDARGLTLDKETEVLTPSYYSVELTDSKRGKVLVEQTATSRAAHLRFTFSSFSNENKPYLLTQATRPTILTSTPTNVSFPTGTIHVDPKSHTICGSSTERQDHIITPLSIQAQADGFRGFFCAQIDVAGGWGEHGIVQNQTITSSLNEASGPLLSAYSYAPASSRGEVIVTVRVGTSFISADQAQANIDAEIPDGQSFEKTAQSVRLAWTNEMGRVQVKGATDEQKDVFFTSVFHTMHYPSEQIEQGRYYSGYDNAIHEAAESYTGYSIWDTFRAEWAWLILFQPNRVPGMITSMLADFDEGGWLPMWKNVVETNIMVGTHADSLIAEAVRKGLRDFDMEKAWTAVWKDASVPPAGDDHVEYADREENVDYEVRAGLSTVYAQRGWVADDIHSESASRTLDYAYDDYAAAVLAHELGKPEDVVNLLMQRAMTAPFTLFNSDTGFMEAKNADGSWAGEDRGWTEGDKWAYSFDVVHNIPALVEHRGGNASFVRSLDEHFDGGHNDHSNEPSHHIPYLYALAGAAHKTQERVREIAQANYDNTPTGLSGNEDCGQMSAWYIFSAMGFYPVDPVSGEYVVGSPFFDEITIDLNQNPSSAPKLLTITAKGATTKPYIKSLTINGVGIPAPVIKHEQISNGGQIVFEMSEKIEKWGNEEVWKTAVPRAGRSLQADHEEL